MHAEDLSAAAAVKQAALQMLTHGGFAIPLPDLGRVTCATRGAASVLASISGTGLLVKFQIGGDSTHAADAVAQELSRTFPGATMGTAEPAGRESGA